ncbi:MAG: hypothetical protein HFH84_14485 [Lachnospiraceae bacterium]|nr:hypothetical protein [Lachnospiraceae bacterium]
MEEKYWKQFENSGRIEDYLSFVNSTGRDERDVSFVGEAVFTDGTGARDDVPSAGGTD